MNSQERPEQICKHSCQAVFTDDNGIYKAVCQKCQSYRVYGHSFGDWQHPSRNIDEVIQNGE